jgi:hypothetical protein
VLNSYTFSLLAAEAVFPHAGAKGAGIETKEECRTAFFLDAIAIAFRLRSRPLQRVVDFSVL